MTHPDVSFRSGAYRPEIEGPSHYNHILRSRALSGSTDVFPMLNHSLLKGKLEAMAKKENFDSVPKSKHL
jgi:hypothetical protein